MQDRPSGRTFPIKLFTSSCLDTGRSSPNRGRSRGSTPGADRPLVGEPGPPTRSASLRSSGPRTGPHEPVGTGSGPREELPGGDMPDGRTAMTGGYHREAEPAAAGRPRRRMGAQREFQCPEPVHQAAEDRGRPAGRRERRSGAACAGPTAAPRIVVKNRHDRDLQEGTCRPARRLSSRSAVTPSTCLYGAVKGCRTGFLFFARRPAETW